MSAFLQTSNTACWIQNQSEISREQGPHQSISYFFSYVITDVNANLGKYMYPFPLSAQDPIKERVRTQ